MSRDRALSISSQEGDATDTIKLPVSDGHGRPTISDTGKDGSAGGGKDNSAATAASSAVAAAKSHCLCGVVSLLECVAGGGVQQPPLPVDRAAKRALRAKHREFNTRAQLAWGKRRRGGGGEAASAQQGRGGGAARRLCHQPRHLPLPLNTSTRVSFAYELTSIAILIDASPSLTAVSSDDDFVGGLFGTDSPVSPFCVPLDRLGSLLKDYLEGLIQPVDVPPVAVTGLGVAFGRWTPQLAVTVAAVYPPTPSGEVAAATLLVRDYRVGDARAAATLARTLDEWATRTVEGGIAARLCGARGNGAAGGGWDGAVVAPAEADVDPAASVEFPLWPSAPGWPRAPSAVDWTRVRSSLKDLLAAGDAALATLPAEGRPVLVIATDCRNVQCGGAFDTLSETARSDVPLSVLDLSLSSSASSMSSSSVSSSTSNPHAVGSKDPHGASSNRPPSCSNNGNNSMVDLLSSSSYPLSVSDDSHSLRDKCHLSGGLFLTSGLLDSYRKTIAGNPSGSPANDYHFSFKKRSIKPNALQWYTLFTLSPFTPSSGSLPASPWMRHPQGPSLLVSSSYQRLSSYSQVFRSVSGSSGLLGRSGAPAERMPLLDSSTAVAPTSAPYDGGGHRVVFAKYNLQPVRVKSLLMTRVLEGYRAKRYGHNTQDHDKVSVHLVLRLADCGVAVHYEASFVSSPHHVPMVGSCHIRLELSGEDAEFLQMVKKMFEAHQYSHGAIENILSLQGTRRMSASTKAAADKICKLLRWTRKEDHLEKELCMPVSVTLALSVLVSCFLVVVEDGAACVASKFGENLRWRLLTLLLFCFQGWGDVDHFAVGSSFLQRVASLSKLQRYRHFSEYLFLQVRDICNVSLTFNPKLPSAHLIIHEFDTSHLLPGLLTAQDQKYLKLSQSAKTCMRRLRVSSVI